MATQLYAKSLGQLIRRVREQRGLTLTKLARESGVAPSSLSEIETGVSVPAVDKVQRIAKALRISVQKVLPDEC